MIRGVGGSKRRVHGPLSLTAACSEAEETMTQDVTRACHLALWEKWNTKQDGSAKIHIKQTFVCRRADATSLNVSAIRLTRSNPHCHPPLNGRRSDTAALSLPCWGRLQAKRQTNGFIHPSRPCWGKKKKTLRPLG